MRIYDISMPLAPGVAIWPGDTPFDYHLIERLADGAAVNLGTLSCSAHAGTHVDAPYHFDELGATLDGIALDALIGQATVVDVAGRQVIEATELPPDVLLGAPRLLLRTGAWPDRTTFPTTIPVIAPDVPAHLAAHGVVLLGVDVPSVDPITSLTLENHRALAAHGITILESAVLTDVPPGVFELFALPLPLVGADAAPVRALLLAK